MKQLLPAPVLSRCGHCRAGPWTVILNAETKDRKAFTRDFWWALLDNWYIWNKVTGEYVKIGPVTKTNISNHHKAHAEAHRRNREEVV